MRGKCIPMVLVVGLLAGLAGPARAAEGEWEITPESQKAVHAGLEWLSRNQGPEGNWGSDDLGIVSLGAMAYLSAGYGPDEGKYKDNVRKALDYVVGNARPSGLLNISNERRDMYNHGLSTFVLTQAYGMTRDRRIGKALDKALKLIAQVQCDDGGWDYVAKRQRRGHDLSLAVMQAKALRGAMDIGLDIPPRTIQLAIKYVRDLYRPESKRADGRYKQFAEADPLAAYPGRFTYNGSKGTTAMAAAGVVCLQEFGQYGDWRILRSADAVAYDIHKRLKLRSGHAPFDAYTLYYAAQAIYQVGGKRWRESYPKLRDGAVKTQARSDDPRVDGSWEGGRLSGTPGKCFGTSVAVFTLSIPNRYLPILQEAPTDPEDKENARR